MSARDERIAASGWVPELQYLDLHRRTQQLDVKYSRLRAERDALAATVSRVRALLDSAYRNRHSIEVCDLEIALEVEAMPGWPLAPETDH